MNDRIVYIVKKDINIFQKKWVSKRGGANIAKWEPQTVSPPSTHMLSYAPDGNGTGQI